MKTVDAGELARALKARVKGEVRFDAGERALYATDASNYRQPPLGVVTPKDAEDVVATVEVCRRLGAPLTSRGGGTSLAGQTTNAAVILDCSRHFNRVLSVDAAGRKARVEPGLVLDRLRLATGKHGLTFAPDPATHNHCTLGGMIGNNSCGAHSVMAQFAGTGARTSDNLEKLEVLTSDGLMLEVGATSEAELLAIIAGGGRRGEIYAGLKALRDRYGPLIRERYPKLPRRVSGYNLDELLPEKGFNVARALTGSEGTCVVVLTATVMLLPEPKTKSLLVLGYPDVFAAADHVPEVLQARPIALEGMDDVLVQEMKRKGLHPDDVKQLPDGKGWLLIEFGADTRAEADEKAKALMRRLQNGHGSPSMKLFDDPHAEERLWKVRESGLGATAFVPGMKDSWPGWEDTAVAPEQLGAYLRKLRALFDRYDYHPALYGHFGQGIVHCRVGFDLVTTPGLEAWRRFLDQAAALVVSFGGSLSGEHGDGQARAELLTTMYGETLVGAFRQFKRLWDPAGILNPGKIVEPYPIVSNLRLGADYAPPAPATFFAYPDDQHNFARAALRCVGVGECRKTDGGTMCPSYMVTREEKHSTRGRSRLLFEMMRGEVVTEGWASPEVKESLDLCLACKGCKSECPVNVDMATYKAEFLAHYHRHHRRPLSAYVFGHISTFARLGSFAPRLSNALLQSELLGGWAKKLLGIAPERRFPALAHQPFTTWFRHRKPGRTNGPRVLLWPDTFNTYFYPQTAQAAVEVLEAAGFTVAIPSVHLCCGRPLYDFGLLETARRWLKDIVGALRTDIRAGTPIVGLEPSCVSVFRDELVKLVPHDEDAQRLSRQARTLGEFIADRFPKGIGFPALRTQALVHGHCHHKSVLGWAEEEQVLRSLALELELPDSGCCGMAGAFGFEAKHYAVSVAAGERVLLPAVRRTPAESLVIADGFSCREQVLQLTGRKPLHLAEVMALALAERRKLPAPRPSLPPPALPALPPEPRA